MGDDVKRIARVALRGETRWVTWSDDDRLELLAGEAGAIAQPTGQFVKRDELRLLCPAVPTKVFGVGANFPGDADTPSRDIPSVFTMPTSALVAHNEVVTLPSAFDSVLVEGELAVVIGRRAHRLEKGSGHNAILGYTIANDLSGRSSSMPFVPPAFKKGSDGFLPLGPCIALGCDWRELTIVTTINGEEKQRGRCGEMMFGCEMVVELASQFITLLPGDVIVMGTPTPKPKASRGDKVRITIDGIGSLENLIS